MFRIERSYTNPTVSKKWLGRILFYGLLIAATLALVWTYMNLCSLAPPAPPPLPLSSLIEKNLSVIYIHHSNKPI